MDGTPDSTSNDEGGLSVWMEAGSSITGAVIGDDHSDQLQAPCEITRVNAKCDR